MKKQTLAQTNRKEKNSSGLRGETGYRTSADFISQRSFTNQTENCFRCGLRISSGIPEGDYRGQQK